MAEGVFGDVFCDTVDGKVVVAELFDFCFLGSAEDIGDVGGAEAFSGFEDGGEDFLGNFCCVFCVFLVFGAVVAGVARGFWVLFAEIR